MTDADRAVRAFEDVVAVETLAPGMVRVVTWSDAYPVDARNAGCNCPDKQYNLEGGMCKHELAALASDVAALPSPGIQTDALGRRTATDGGECEDCAELPDDFPCAECYIKEGEEINA